MLTTTMRRSLVALVAVTTIGGLSACGSDDGGADPDTGDAQSTDEPPADEQPTDAGSTDDEGSADEGDSDGSGHQFESVDICAVAADEITALIDPNGTGNVTSEWFDEGLSDDSKTCSWSGDFGNQLTVEISTYDMFRPLSEIPADENPQELPGPWDEGWTATSIIGQQMSWHRDEITFNVDVSLNSDGQVTPELAETIDAAVKDAGY